MQGKRWRRQRKAVSPILATVILIAITLIAAVAIAGFVFGLFGAFSSAAQVSVTSVSCSAGRQSCTLTLHNTGTAITYTSPSGTITYAGTTVMMNCGTSSAGGSTPTSIQVSAGGGYATIQCWFTAPSPQLSPSAGQQFVGTVGLANGGQVQFSGTFGI